MALGVFRTKNLDDILADAEAPGGLTRTLGASDLVLLGIGAIIGAGIFATVGTAAAGAETRPGAGPALMISFVITAVVCSFTALCYAELASMVPISGSAYTYSYATLGEVIAWIIGWDLIIEYAVGNVSVAISWGNYFRELLAGFGIKVPLWMSMEYRSFSNAVERGEITWDAAPHPLGFPIVFNVLAAFIVGALTVVLVWGVKESARFNAVMVGIKIVILTFFIITGLFYVDPGNYTPFAPKGFVGISTAAAIVFFAYIGFDAVSTVAEETKEPQRNLPIGIIGSLIICTVFYVVVAAVFTGLISYTDLQATDITKQAEPLTYALRFAGEKEGPSRWINFAVGLIAFGSVIAHTAVLLVFQLGQPRIFYSMARDGLLPKVFAKIHPKYHTPHITTIVTGVVVGAFAGVASLDEMVDLTNIGTLFAFILVCAGVIVLRRTDPDRPRPFRLPGGHTIPILGIITCVYLMYFLPSTSWFRFAAWLNFGFVIYIAYGALHSRLTGRHLAEDKAAHDAQTAWAGATLGALGLLILCGAMAFDIHAQRLRAVDAAEEAVKGAQEQVAEAQKEVDAAKAAADPGRQEVAVARLQFAQSQDEAARVQQEFASAQRAVDKAGTATASDRAGLVEAQMVAARAQAAKVEARVAATEAQRALADAKAKNDQTAVVDAQFKTGLADTKRAAAETLGRYAEARLQTQKVDGKARDEAENRMKVANAQLAIDEAQVAAVEAAAGFADAERSGDRAKVTAAQKKVAAALARSTFAKAKLPAVEAQIAGDNARLVATQEIVAEAQERVSETLAEVPPTVVDKLPKIDTDPAESLWHPSWFMIVPLLLNIVVLFPTIAIRAWRARSTNPQASYAGRATLSLVLAVCMFFGCVAYLGLVLSNR